jgi:beta-glucosidase
MLKTKSLQPLLLLAASVLAAPACSLEPPFYERGDGGPTVVTCAPASGIDGGAAVDPTIFMDPVVCGSTPHALKTQLKSQFKYAPGYQSDPAVQDTVKTLMSQMTLKDKTWQMNGMPYGAAGKLNFTDTQRSRDLPKTGIRGYRYRDASRGMNLGEDMMGIQPNAGTVDGASVGYSTSFPVSMARGAAFDLDLEYEIGEAIADEMLAAKETLLLAPCMNILRNPLWGRAQETYGEDPFHMGRLASAMTVGVQEHIAANAKHYLGYDIENGRDFNDVGMDEQTLRETYGRHFRMVIQDAGVASVMAAYNMVNGLKAVDSRHILTDVLRTDFGFKGFVLSDWWAMRPQAVVDGVDTGTLKSYAVSAMQAGLDVELPWALNYGQLENLVNAGGGVTEADIDVAVNRILEQKVRFNMHDLTIGKLGLGTSKSTYKKSRVGGCGYELHKELAKKAALESMVLLKNANNTLPIKPSVTKVAVLGATVSYQTMNYGKLFTTTLNFATDANQGDMGSSRVFSDPAHTVPPYQGMLAEMKRRGIIADDESNKEQHVWTGSTAADVKDADFVVVVAGLTAGDEGEEYTKAGDRTKGFGMDAKRSDPNLQNNLIAAVAATGKPMVVVIEGGSIVDMPWLEQVSAVVMAWYPGMRGGEALAQLLWGEVSFSGKLPFTWGRQVSDFEELKADNGATNFDYYVGYSRFDRNKISPLFPFGHGLSYTTFKYNDLQLGCSTLSEGGILPVLVTVENAGTVAGDEIVMVWVSHPDTKARRPQKELRGFTRVSLNPGEAKQVLIPIRLKDLDYFDQSTNQWVVESGSINITVGGNSTNLPLSGTVAIQGYTKASSNY